MLYSIGSMKNLPADFNLNSIPDFFKQRIFSTSVGFRCYFPSLRNNYPVEEKGILYINKMNDMLKIYYFTRSATYVSVGIYIGNTIRKIEWYQVMDGRHSSVYDSKIIGKKFVSDSDVKEIVNTFLTRYDDTELWNLIDTKFHKDQWKGYTNKHDPHIRRGKVVSINTNEGVVVGKQDVVTSKDRGIAVFANNGSAMAVFATGERNILGHHQKSTTYIHTDRKLLIQSRNRPVVRGNDAGQGGNKEIVIRADIRWKQLYNGRQGLKDISYPPQAREVIVQLYNDVAGRVHRSQYPHPGYRWGLIPFGRTEGALWDDIHPPQYQIGGEAVSGIMGRDRDYKEYAPMHFVRGIYNRINQDTAFVEHHGDCRITISNIGYDSIVNGRSYSAMPHNFNPFDQDMALVDERYGFSTNRTRELPKPQYNSRGYKPIHKTLTLSTMRRYNFWPFHILSESVWRSTRNLGAPHIDTPSIRRVWWR